MAVTLQDLRDIFYGILREEEDSSAYPLILCDQFLNAAQLRICNGKVKNPLTKETVRKGQLSFLFTDKFYSNVAPTSLSEDVAVGATTLTVGSTTNFPSTGVLYIAGNIISYTGKTSTTFTGCSNVLFAFQGGMEVSIAFAVPADFASVINVVYNNKFKMQAQLYDDIYENLNQYKGSYRSRNNAVSMYGNPWRQEPFYTIKDNAYLLIFNMNDTSGIVRFRYEKMPTTMSTGASTATISNDIYAKTTIPYLAVGEMLFNRGEEQRAGELLNFAMGQVKEMYEYYNDTSYEDISGVQYGMGKSVLNI